MTEISGPPEAPPPDPRTLEEETPHADARRWVHHFARALKTCRMYEQAENAVVDRFLDDLTSTLAAFHAHRDTGQPRHPRQRLDIRGVTRRQLVDVRAACLVRQPPCPRALVAPAVWHRDHAGHQILGGGHPDGDLSEGRRHPHEVTVGDL